MLALGAWLVVSGNASPGIMVAATVLVARALQPVEQLIAGWKSLVEVRGAWRRLHSQVVNSTSAQALRLPPVRGEVSLERVVLLADVQRPPVIKGVSLTLAPGECLGLVGPSASGKTTLVRLMLGLRVPNSGTVRLDGVDLAGWPRDQLIGAIGYLPQDVELFAGTVAHNIARLGEIDSEHVIEAARLAGVHDMILRLPSAYETEVGDAGSALSGGQRQRIALARAVYGSPKLVVLDEPNANLDSEGEEALSAGINQLKQAGTTVVLVSHRPSLMRCADKLAVLRDGSLDLFGPREQVLARLGLGTVHPLRRPGVDIPQEAQA
jgi:PrtD family type I secretion system ABC transporter